MRAALKRQLNHKNPNENLLDLSMSTFCGLIRAKNDGDHFLVEIESREFTDNLVSIIKISVLNRDLRIRYFA